MRKRSIYSIDFAPPRRRSRARTALLITLGLLLAPLVYEGSLLCLARWQAMTGQVSAVETPVIDTLASAYEATAHAVQGTASRTFRYLPWNPFLVIGLAGAWALIGGRLLLRHHR